MRCPFCSADDDKVVDSRPADDAAAVRRRRECLGCGRRFTTYERVEELPLVVAKRSGELVPFEPQKLRAGIEHAVAGSAIDDAAIDALAHEVEEKARAAAERALESGEEQSLEAMDALERKIAHDAVAQIEGVRTESKGEEPDRFVVVFPE